MPESFEYRKCIFRFLNVVLLTKTRHEEIHYLHMFTVMSPSRELDPSECDWTLEGHFDGCLLYSILSI